MKFSPVVLTGATGYLGSQLMYQLLNKGYDLRITTRNKAKTLKDELVIRFLDEFPGKLSVYEADLLNEGDFDMVMEGANSLIHAASPFKIEGVKNPKKELVDPAVIGTRNVLKSASKHGIKRVVQTSSVVAVYGDAADIDLIEEDAFSEKHWNATSSINHQAYNYSKTVAEKEALAMSLTSPWSFVTINPGFILGPSLTKRSDSTSIDFMINLLNGKYAWGVPNIYFGIVDVRDVAKAHILALEQEDLKGRFICSNAEMNILGIVNILRAKFSKSKKLAKTTIPNLLMYLIGPLVAGLSWTYLKNNLGIPLHFNNERSKKRLGIEYRAVEETLLDHAEQLANDKLIR